MQQTEQLNLNLVETTDIFSPEPLNENMRLLETALAGKGTCSVVTGSFEGNDTYDREIVLGFTPKLVILSGYYDGNALSFAAENWGAMFRGGNFYPAAGFTLTENGFRVNCYAFNRKDKTMFYTAFT